MNRPGADPGTEPRWLARIRQGYALLQQGRAEIAERVGREVLDSRPGDAVALNLVAIALNAQGKHSDAAQLFAELTRLQPQERPHWGNLGTALRAAGQLQPALDAYQQAAALGEKSANFHYNVGLLHLDRDDFDFSVLSNYDESLIKTNGNQFQPRQHQERNVPLIEENRGEVSHRRAGPANLQTGLDHPQRSGRL